MTGRVIRCRLLAEPIPLSEFQCFTLGLWWAGYAATHPGAGAEVRARASWDDWEREDLDAELAPWPWPGRGKNK